LKFGIVPRIKVDVMLADTSVAIDGQRIDGDYGRIDDVLTKQQAQLDEVIKRFPAAEDGVRPMC
jgi:hypothetical protein